MVGQLSKPYVALINGITMGGVSCNYTKSFYYYY